MAGITIFWIALMVIFIVIELNTINLYTVWFALGACAAAILSVQMTEGYLAQTATFVIVSGAAVMLTRPFARKVTGKSVPTNADRVVGEEAVVTERIEESALGQVKVLGHIWTAKAKNAEAVYNVGDVVIVEEIQGVKLIVKSNSNI